MGPTGAGKSTFIREYTKNTDVVAGHSLQSITKEVRGWATTVPPEFQGLLKERRLILVDTPGFDDSFSDDSEILRKVSVWLARCYNDAMAVAGIVYISDISQKRMFGSTRMSLNMLMKLCGEESLNRVVLATSQWDTLTSEASKGKAEERQDELKMTYWKAASDLRASIRAIRQKPQDLEAVVNHVLKTYFDIQSSDIVVFGIQKEIVDLKMSLPATAAGRELKLTLDELLRLHKAKRRGGHEDDPEQKENLEQKIALLKGQIRAMRLPLTDRIKDFLHALETRMLARDENHSPKPVPFESRSRDIVIV
ncbi:hypothetical protein BKA70DRAFT_1107178 [Coprinopsis sp. MPI-PUGE-AT-0042]|nr:hypothetical protein BKA70DRAFT_1107178 [Coprinopsis sp. MPI-PUGE-AT-0042]